MPAPPPGVSGGNLGVLLARGGGYATGVVVQVVVQVLALPILTRALLPGQYGIVATALVVMNLLAVLVDLGLGNAVARSYFLRPAGPSRARALLLAAVVTTLILTVVSDAAGPLWARVFGELEYGPALRLAVWGAAAIAVRNAATAYLRSGARVGWVLALTVGTTAGAQIVGLAALWLWRADATAYLGGLVAGMAAGAAGGVIVSRLGVRALADRQFRRWAVSFSLPTVPYQLSTVFIWFADRVVIERFLELAEVGRYQIAYSVGSLGLMVGMAVNQAWAPAVHSAAPGERWGLVETSTAAMLRLAGLAAGGVAMGAPVFLLVIAPPSYQPRALAPVVAIVAVALVPLMSQLSAVNVVTDVGRTRILGLLTLCAAAANILFNIVLVPMLGLVGAAFATLLSYALLSVTMTVAAGRMAPYRPGWSPLLRAWGVAIMFGLIGALLPVGGWWALLRLAIASGLGIRLLALARVMGRSVPGLGLEGPE